MVYITIASIVITHQTWHKAYEPHLVKFDI